MLVFLESGGTGSSETHQPQNAVERPGGALPVLCTRCQTHNLETHVCAGGEYHALQLVAVVVEFLYSAAGPKERIPNSGEVELSCLPQSEPPTHPATPPGVVLSGHCRDVFEKPQPGFLQRRFFLDWAGTVLKKPGDLLRMYTTAALETPTTRPVPPHLSALHAQCFYFKEFDTLSPLSSPKRSHHLHKGACYRSAPSS